MIDLSREMGELYDRLGPAPAGRCRVLQFAAATGGEGTSTLAREFARVAAERALRPVWLVDLDLWRGAQVEALARAPQRYGALGPEVAGAPGEAAFFAVEPPSRGPDGRPWPSGRYLNAHSAMGRRLWVTRFRADAVRRNQSVEIVRDGGYWAALRRHAEYVVVDAPAYDRSQAALVVAPFMDATVLVVAAETSDPRGAGALRDAIDGAGGRCAGLVFNRSAVEPPRFMKALLK